MDLSTGHIEWREGVYLLVRIDGDPGNRLMAARIGIPADSYRLTEAIRTHPDTWISGSSIVFREIGPAEASGIQPITLLSPDAHVPGKFNDIISKAPSGGSISGWILLLITVILIGLRQNRAQAQLSYRGSFSRFADIRKPRAGSWIGSFVRHSFGLRPGDWSSIAPTPNTKSTDAPSQNTSV